MHVNEVARNPNRGNAAMGGALYAACFVWCQKCCSAQSAQAQNLKKMSSAQGLQSEDAGGALAGVGVFMQQDINDSR